MNTKIIDTNKTIKRIVVYIISIMLVLICLNACNAVHTDGIDLSKMDDTMYGFGPVIIEIENKVYFMYDPYSASKNEGTPGIYQLDHGSLALNYEGDVLGIQKYDDWIYFREKATGNTAYIRRYNTKNGEVETIRENYDGESEHVVCPAGIFWIKKFMQDEEYVQQIKRTDLDGSNESTLYELGEEDKGRLGSLCVYHHSLYFCQYIEHEAPMDLNTYLTMVECRLDLETGIVEKPEGLQTWKVDESETYTYEPEDGEPTTLSMYDTVGSYWFGEEGWIYFTAIPLWWDPESGLEFWRSNAMILYKSKEDGTERTKIKAFDNGQWPIGIWDGWIYYSDQAEVGIGTILRMKEDGSDIQTVVDQDACYWYIEDNYLYYSLNSDENGYPINNFYRIDLDTIGEPERLY